MSEISYINMEKQHCAEVAALLLLCFPTMPPEEQYDAPSLEEVVDIFPEGTILALDGTKVVGMGTGLFVNIDFDNLPPTEDDLLDSSPQYEGSYDADYYFGSDMAVHPAYRGRGIARQIYNRRKAVVQQFNKKGFAAASALPGYANHKELIDAPTYINRVVAGELFDPTLSVQLRNGFRVIVPIQHFYVYPDSNHWSALILWDNPTYQEG